MKNIVFLFMFIIFGGGAISAIDHVSVYDFQDDLREASGYYSRAVELYNANRPSYATALTHLNELNRAFSTVDTKQDISSLESYIQKYQDYSFVIQKAIRELERVLEILTEGSNIYRRYVVGTKVVEDYQINKQDLRERLGEINDFRRNYLLSSIETLEKAYNQYSDFIKKKQALLDEKLREAVVRDSEQSAEGSIPIRSCIIEITNNSVDGVVIVLEQSAFENEATYEKKTYCYSR